MNYAWEAALAADRSGIRREDLRYLPSGSGSPYAEIVQEEINNQSVGQNQVELNPLYRFAREFSAVFDRNLREYPRTRELFFDICMHYLVQLDLRQVLVYIGIKADEKEQKQMEFLRDMFLPVNYEVFLFWEHHFGIMDVEETMVLDEMVLF